MFGSSPIILPAAGSASVPSQPTPKPRQRPQAQTQSTDRVTHLVELIEHRDRRFPVNAGIGDAHAIFEPLGSLGRDVLTPSVDMRFNHHAYNRAFASFDLLANIIEHEWLVIVILRRVPVYLRT